MAWQQLVVDLGTVEQGVLEDALVACGAQAVSYRDAGDEPVLEPAPGTTPLWPSTRVLALFDMGTDRELLVQRLESLLTPVPLPEIRFLPLAERDWAEQWRREARPMQFGSKLWVCPHGSPPPVEGATTVWLDPGLAFGTGGHPTTALCLEWLDRSDLRGLRLLDYGCGSGILAVAGLLLGARRATAVDHDPQAIVATAANAARNGVASRLAVVPPDELAALEYDAVVANILAGPLVALAGSLTRLVRPGGSLVLSGVLSSQVADLERGFRSGFDLEPPTERDGWVRLAGTRRVHPMS